MKNILSYIKDSFKGTFIMIAPPYIEAIEPGLQRYKDASIEMNNQFMNLSKEYDIKALDASSWNIEMGYDGVHFSVEGHKQFAQKLLSAGEL
jgi:lysophospholipase L1-like esterase